MVTVVGIGNKAGQVTTEGLGVIANADALILRTAKSKAGAAFFASKVTNGVICLDDIYESAADFNALNIAIADKIADICATAKNVVYCVDGDGFNDTSVELLYGRNLVKQIIAGVSSGVKLPSGAVLTVSAYQLVSESFNLDSSFSICVTGIDSKILCGQVKLILSQTYGDECDIVFAFGQKQTILKLYELDRQPRYDYSASVFIKGEGGFKKQRYTFADLMRILKRLTGVGGCPWDIAQSHKSIRENMIEEAYEAADAIDSENADELCEEVGDVLLQAIFHCDIAARLGEFELNDCITTLCNKLYTRHTHIFGQHSADSGEAALGFWEQAKAEEKGYESIFDKLNRIPKCFPPQLRSKKIAKKLIKESVFASNSNATQLASLLNDIAKTDIQFAEKLNAQIEEVLQQIKSLEGKA